MGSLRSHLPVVNLALKIGGTSETKQIRVRYPRGRRGFAGIRMRGNASDRFLISGTHKGELSGSERVNKVSSTKLLGWSAVDYRR